MKIFFQTHWKCFPMDFLVRWFSVENNRLMTHCRFSSVRWFKMWGGRDSLHLHLHRLLSFRLWRSLNGWSRLYPSERKSAFSPLVRFVDDFSVVSDEENEIEARISLGNTFNSRNLHLWREAFLGWFSREKNPSRDEACRVFSSESC